MPLALTLQERKHGLDQPHCHGWLRCLWCDHHCEAAKAVSWPAILSLSDVIVTGDADRPWFHAGCSATLGRGWQAALELERHPFRLRKIEPPQIGANELRLLAIEAHDVRRAQIVKVCKHALDRLATLNASSRTAT